MTSHPKITQLKPSDDESKYLKLICDASADTLGPDLVEDVK